MTLLPVVVVTTEVHPPVLSGNERAAEDQTEDDGGCQRIDTRAPPADRPEIGRHDVSYGASHGPSEVDEHVQTQQHEPDDRRGSVETTRDLECMPVEESHRHPAAEEDDRGRHKQGREQPHRRLRRALLHIGAAARVIAREPPPRARELEEHRRDQGKTDEHVPRHERVHAEQDRRDHDEHGSEQKQPYRTREALVSCGIHFRGTEIGPRRRR